MDGEKQEEGRVLHISRCFHQRSLVFVQVCTGVQISALDSVPPPERSSLGALSKSCLRNLFQNLSFIVVCCEFKFRLEA